MSKPSDEDPATGPTPDPETGAEPGPFGAAVTVPGGSSSFSAAVTVPGGTAAAPAAPAAPADSGFEELTPSRAHKAHPPPRPVDADFPGPPPSLEIPNEVAPAKAPEKPESKFPEIDAAIRIVDVDSRPLERRSTALNPWNVKTPGLGVEAKAALDALREAHEQQAEARPEPPPPKRQWLLLLGIATGVAILVFSAIIAFALLRRGAAPPEPVATPLKLPEIPVPPVTIDEPTRVAKREAMIAAFDRHDFSQGMAIGEELEAAKVLDVEAEFWLAEACRHANRPADSIKRYEGFISAHPESKLVDAAHYYAAEVARREGQVDVARAHYKAIIADEKSGLRSKAKKRLQSLK